MNYYYMQQPTQQSQLDCSPGRMVLVANSQSTRLPSVKKLQQATKVIFQYLASLARLLNLAGRRFRVANVTLVKEGTSPRYETVQGTRQAMHPFKMVFERNWKPILQMPAAAYCGVFR